MIVTTSEVWNRHLGQFNNLCDEYNTNQEIKLIHFANSVQHKSKAYHYYKLLKRNQERTWPALCIAFRIRYRSDTKRTRFSNNLKELTFQQFRHHAKSDDGAFKKLIPEIEG